jgi:hypothetical protein
MLTSFVRVDLFRPVSTQRILDDEIHSIVAIVFSVKLIKRLSFTGYQTRSDHIAFHFC